jgi:hypothetical protein
VKVETGATTSCVFTHLKTSKEELEKSLDKFHVVCNDLQSNENNNSIKEHLRNRLTKIFVSW